MSYEGKPRTRKRYLQETIHFTYKRYVFFVERLQKKRKNDFMLILHKTENDNWSSNKKVDWEF